MRTMGILVLLAGLAVLGYGIWQYYDDKQEFDSGEIRSTVEDGNTPLPVWVGGLMVVAGGVAMVATRGKR